MNDDRRTVWAAVIEIIATIMYCDEEAVRLDAKLVEELQMHSLALLEMIYALELRFDLPPFDTELEYDVNTVGGVVDAVVDVLANIRDADG